MAGLPSFERETKNGLVSAHTAIQRNVAYILAWQGQLILIHPTQDRFQRQALLVKDRSVQGREILG